MDFEALHRRNCDAGTAISAHLPRLRELATGLHLVVEFGVKRGASSLAFLLGAQRVVSYDIVPTPEAKALAQAIGDCWDYRIEDARKADVPQCCAIFFDSLHTYGQVDAELKAHGNKASRYLIFHDVTTFGEVGAAGETGRHSWTYAAGKGSVPEGHWGIRPAIDSFQIANQHWRIKERHVHSHGLLVLERR